MEAFMIDHQKVADYIILFFRERGENITNLKLQKLLYYAQAWNLAINNKRLMDANFQAWIHGPVLCRCIQQIQRLPVRRPIVSEIDAPDIDERIHVHLDDVLSAYGGILMLMSWNGLPMRMARGQ